MQPNNTELLVTPRLEARDNIFWLYIPIIISILMLLLIWRLDQNINMFYTINGISGLTGTAIWQIFTIFGDGLISALLLTFWIKKKPEIAWSFLIATIFYMILLNLLKDGLNFKRPPAILDHETFFIAGKAFEKRSFPSGHTTAIFALCGVISLYYKSIKIRLMALTFAVVVGFSRVLIGVHWPADIFAGAILGWFSAAIGIFLSKRSRWGYNKIFKYSISILFSVAAFVLIFSYKTGYKDAIIAQKILGIFVIVYLSFIYFLKDRVGNILTIFRN